MFQVGEQVVYGNNGICSIRGISTLDMPGVSKDRLYYVLSPELDLQGTVYVPVDNPKAVLRKIMSKEDAIELIAGAAEVETISITNDKLREEVYRNCMKSCESKQWLRVIRTIYKRKQDRIGQGKKITAIDERYMKLAEDHLYSELSAALGIPRSEVPSYIEGQLRNMNDGAE